MADSSLFGLVDGDRNKIPLQGFDNLGICKVRRSVEHSVVSDAAHRKPVHGPNEERFVFLKSEMLRRNEGGLPGNGGPGFFTRLDALMKLFELFRRDPGGERENEKGGEEKDFLCALGNDWRSEILSAGGR